MLPQYDGICDERVHSHGQESARRAQPWSNERHGTAIEPYSGDLQPVVEAVPGAQPPNLVPPGVRTLSTVPRWCSLGPALV
jgi:hypothetical protein